MPNGDREHKRKQDAWAREQARHEELRDFGQDVFDQQGNLKPDALNAYRQVQQRVKQRAGVQTGPRTAPVTPPSIPLPTAAPPLSPPAIPGVEPDPSWQPTPWFQQEVSPIIDELPSALPGTIGPVAQVAAQATSKIVGPIGSFFGWLGKQGQPTSPEYRGAGERDPSLPPPPPAADIPDYGITALPSLPKTGEALKTAGQWLLGPRETPTGGTKRPYFQMPGREEEDLGVEEEGLGVLEGTAIKTRRPVPDKPVEEPPTIKDVGIGAWNTIIELDEKFRRPAWAQVRAQKGVLADDPSESIRVKHQWPENLTGLLGVTATENKRVLELSKEYFQKLVEEKGGLDKVSEMDKQRANWRANELAYIQALEEGAIIPWTEFFGQALFDVFNVIGLPLGKLKGFLKVGKVTEAADAAEEAVSIIKTSPDIIKPPPPEVGLQAGLDLDVMGRAAKQAEFAPEQMAGATLPSPRAGMGIAEEAAPAARVGDALNLVSDEVGPVVRISDRDIVLVEMADKTRQPFYRSTGRNSGMPEKWLPFDGVLPEDGTWKGWFIKDRFGGDNRADPLYRYGTEELKAIGNRLDELPIPRGRDVGNVEVNRFLDKPATWDELEKSGTVPFSRQEAGEFRPPPRTTNVVQVTAPIGREVPEAAAPAARVADEAQLPLDLEVQARLPGVLDDPAARWYEPELINKRLIPMGESPASKIGVQAARQEEISKAIPGVERAAARALEDAPVRPPGQPDPVVSGAVPGNRFVIAFRSLNEIIPEVVFEGNPFFRAIVSTLKINPSRAAESGVAKAIVAYLRQKSSTEEIIETVVGSALDSHMRMWGQLGELGRGIGRKLGTDVLDEPVLIRANGTFGDTGAIWNDVFANPDKFKTKLTDREIAYIYDYRAVVEEANNLRVSESLPSLDFSANKPDGWFYIPRVVEEIRGFSVNKRTKAHLERFYELAADGKAAGINYLNDPRQTLKLHLRATYNEIARKQLDDIVEDSLVLPSRIVPENVRITYEKAKNSVRAAQKEIKRLSVPQVGLGLRRAAAEGRDISSLPADAQSRAAAAKVRKSLATERKVAQAKLEKAKSAYGPALDSYKRARISARNQTTAPGNIFGLAPDQIDIRNWRGKFLPEDDVKKLEEVLNMVTPSNSPWRKGLEFLGKIGGYVRFFSATVDLGAPFIHGLVTLARHPTVWSKGFVKSFEAFFRPATSAKFVRDNLDVVQEMARNGVPVGDVELFTVLAPGKGFQISSTAKRVLDKAGLNRLSAEQMQQLGRARDFAGIVSGQSLGRFQAAYNMYLLQTRMLMWKSLRNSSSFRGKQSELAGYIRNMTGGLDTKALGVGPQQQQVESAFLAFSPRLFRSTLALVSDALQVPVRVPLGAAGVVAKPTAQQMASFQALAAFAGAAHGIYALTGVALGKSPEEIKAGLNPLNGKKYLSHNINGEWIGVGGQVRAITQFIASSLASIAGIEGPRGREYKLGDLIDRDKNENPIIQLAMSRGAGGVRMIGAGIEGVSRGKIDALPYAYVDNPIDALSQVGYSALPFFLQGTLEGEGIVAGSAGFMGLRTSPATPGEQKQMMSAEIAEELGVVGDITNQGVLDIRGYSEGTEWPKELLGKRASDAMWYDQDPKVRAAIKVHSNFEQIDNKSKELLRDFDTSQYNLQMEIERLDGAREDWADRLYAQSVRDTEGIEDPQLFKYFDDNYAKGLSGIRIEGQEPVNYFGEINKLYDKKYKDMPESESMFGVARAVQSALLFEDDISKVRELLGKDSPPLRYEEGEEAGKMNWPEYNRRKEWLSRAYSDQFIEDTKEESRIDLHPMEKRYLELKDIVKASGYYDVDEQLAENYGLTKELKEYQKLIWRGDKEAFAEDNPIFETRVLGQRSRRRKHLRAVGAQAVASGSMRPEDSLEEALWQLGIISKRIQDQPQNITIPYRSKIIP